MTADELIAELRDRGVSAITVLEAGAALLMEQNPKQAEAMMQMAPGGLDGAVLDTGALGLG